MDWTTRIDSSHVGLPEEEAMATDQGLWENHEYRDLRWLDLDDFESMWEQEGQLLEYEGDLSSDEAFEELCDNEVYVMDLDPGVASTVVALAALGAVPVTSCSGGPGHRETHPLVLCWALSEHMGPILEAADAAGVEVEGVGSGVLVYTLGDVSLMRTFARRLIDGLRTRLGQPHPS